MKQRKNCGIEALKARYGWICITPWIIGLVLFFGLPIIQSIIYCFSNVTLAVGGLQTDFVGLKHFKYIFNMFLTKFIIIRDLIALIRSINK